MANDMRRAECHPQKRMAARGLCWACYAMSRRNPGSIVEPARGPRWEEPDIGDAPALDPDVPCCYVCARDDVRLIRFSLIRNTHNNGRHYGRGAGGITMCEACWRGLRHHSYKAPYKRYTILTPAQRAEVIQRHRSGARMGDLAMEFGVGRTTIYNLVARHTMALIPSESA